ncbi:MAG: hypothetical protein LBR27_04245 [Bifidobacteriaceae bacterium]|nr:hypothetical protein [Bifidobacteriaceae bacterium]
MDTAALYAAIDQLSVPARQRYLAELARTLPPAEMTALLSELAEGSWFTRRVSLTLAHLAGQSDHLVRMATDPSVGARAIMSAVELGRAADVAAMIDHLPREHRRALFNALVWNKVTDVADAIVHRVFELYGPAAAAAVLGACSPMVAAEILPEVLHTAGTIGQTTLVTLTWRLPGVVGEALAAYIRPLPPRMRRQEVAARINLLAMLAETRPETVFDLFEDQLPPASPKAVRCVEHLVRHDPARVVTILSDVDWRTRRDYLTRSVVKSLVKAGWAEAMAPALWADTEAGHPAAYCRLLKATPPSQRPALIKTEWLDTPPQGSAFTYAVLDLFPQTERHACARVLADRYRKSEYRQAEANSFGPFTEAKDRLTELTRRPAAEDRAAGYAYLLRCALRERSSATLEAALTGLTDLAAQPDAVHLAVVRTLASHLHQVRLLTPGALEWLEQFIRYSAQAADTSNETLSQLVSLMVRLVDGAVRTGHPEVKDWALRQLETLLTPRVQSEFRLRGAARETVIALLPVIRPWARTLELPQALHLARRLDTTRDQRVLDITGPWLMQAATQEGPWQRWAISAALADPRYRDQRLEQILEAQPSAAYIATCTALLIRRRTDLLDRYLVAQPPAGPFSQRNRFFLPICQARAVSGHAIGRWLPRQQQAYLEALAERMATKKRQPVSWRIAMNLIGACTSADPFRLGPYLVSADPEVWSAALGALRLNENPLGAAQTLLDHAGDPDMANAAVYALAPALRRLEPGTVADLLRPFLTGERAATPGAMAEMVRLAGVTRLPGLVPLLRAAFAWPGLNRDVMGVIIQTLAPQADQVRDIYTEVPFLAPAMARAVILSPPSLALPPAARPIVAEAVTQALTCDDRGVRLAARAVYHKHAPWAPDGAQVLANQLWDPDNPQWEEYARTLAHIASYGVATEVLYNCCAELMEYANDSMASTLPGVHLDLPNLRRVAAVVRALIARPIDQTPPALDTLQALADLLATREETFFLAIEAQARLTFRIQPPVFKPAQFEAIAALVAARPWAIHPAAHLVERAFDAGYAAINEQAFCQAAERIAQTPEALLAMPLVAGAAAAAGWPRRWRDVVTALRSHPDPAVRAASRKVDMSAKG